MKHFRITNSKGDKVLTVMNHDEQRNFGLFAVADDVCFAVGAVTALNGSIVVAVADTSKAFDALTVESELTDLLNNAVK